MKRAVILIISLAILTLLIILISAPWISDIWNRNKTSGNTIATTSTQPATNINYGNIEQILSKNMVIKKLPNKGTISLRFYNFNSGERQWEKSYILTQGNVKEGTAIKPDMEIIIHSKYLKELTDQNFCEIIKKANKNGDLGTNLFISKTSFMIKYFSVIKYRDCLGF